MTIISSYDWASDTFTHHGDNLARTAWREAVTEIAEKAKATLPDCNGRVDAAVKIVLAGDVELLEDGTAKVGSQSNGITKYFIVNGECSCKDYGKAPSNWCKHRISAGLAKRAHALVKTKMEQQNNGVSNGIHSTPVEQLQPQVEPQSEPVTPIGELPTQSEPAVSPEPTSPIEGSVTPHIPAQFLTEIHGKQFVQYAGLLAMAHARGLVTLSAHFINVSNDLALAEATVEFSDGKIFSECADSTPQNVGPTVRAHFPRIALTRAKARCLRDALNISVCSVEEMEA